MVLQDMTIFSNKNTNPLLKMHGQRQKLKHRFDVIHKLGQGTYGKVQLAVDKDSGQQVAIKTIRKSKIETEQDLIRIRREIQIMSSVQHPHIIHIYEVFENKEKIVLVMQYASGGELYDYLSEKKVLAEIEARRLFRQIASAIYYCHKNKICHRDLKLENIFLDEKGNAKIGDFGLSNVYDNRHFLTTFCGSPLYASPEIVKGTPYYGPEVDCWSLGVLLYTLVYGAMPFDGSNFKRLVKQISEADYYEPKNKSEASGLIKHLLTVSPAKRANIIDICAHWWVNQGCEHVLTDIAEDMANLTPVRLDFLLALAPPVTPTDEAPSVMDQGNNEANCNVNAQPAAQPLTDKSNQKVEVKTDENSLDGMNDYLNGSCSDSSSSSHAKRRSLSVPDIAERAMDFFIANKTEESENDPNVTQKRRDVNDSRSCVAPSEGRKKKPRMGVSALSTDANVADDSESTELKTENLNKSGDRVSTVKLQAAEEQKSQETEKVQTSSQNVIESANLVEDKPSDSIVRDDVAAPEEETKDAKDAECKKEEMADEVKNQEATGRSGKEEIVEKSPDLPEKSVGDETAAKTAARPSKPNLVRRKKKAKEGEKDDAPKPKSTSPVKEIGKDRQPHDFLSKMRDEKIAKRPKKIQIPSCLQSSNETSPVVKSDKKVVTTPGRLTEARKSLDNTSKVTPKRAPIIPISRISDVKKNFEGPSNKAVTTPQSETRRKSSVSGPLFRKSVSPPNNDAAVKSGQKKESSPSGKESTKTVRSKVKLAKPKSAKVANRCGPKVSGDGSEKPKAEIGVQPEVTTLEKQVDRDSESKPAPADLDGNADDGDIPSSGDSAESCSVADSHGSSSDADKTELVIREEKETIRREDEIEKWDDETGSTATDDSGRDREGSVASSTDDSTKNAAKSILKRNIAKAKLTERRLSKQNSLPEEGNPPGTPPSGFYTPPVTKSTFKMPTPFSVEKNDQPIISKAEIVLKRQQQDKPRIESVKKSANVGVDRTESAEEKQTFVPTTRRSSATGTAVDLTGGHAITKSYRKFTFTKDGKCIEETGKIFKNDPDGQWTTIKTTTVKTNPNVPMTGGGGTKATTTTTANYGKVGQENVNPPPPPPPPKKVERSDSASSSGPDDIFEDLFDSFTGDTTFFSLKRMNSLVKKHFGRHHPFFERHAATFDQNSPFETMRSRRRSSSQTRKNPSSSSSSFADDKVNDDDDSDIDSPFSAVGSQNIQRLLKDFHKDVNHDFIHGRFSTLGRPKRRQSSSWFTDRHHPAESDRESLFDSFVSSGGTKRHGSEYGRSFSTDRNYGADGNRYPFDDGSFSSKSHARTMSDSANPDYSRQSSSHYSYSRQSSNDGEPSGGQYERQSTNVPEYGRQSSTQSSYPPPPASDYGRQDSTKSDLYGSHDRQSSGRESKSSANDFSRQNSQFTETPPPPPPQYGRQSSSAPTFRQTVKFHTVPENDRFTPTRYPSDDDDSRARGADDQRPSSASDPRSNAEDAYGRQSSVSSGASAVTDQDGGGGGGFRATIRLSRSGFEPPQIQHSVYGTMRPHIRIQYTRSGSGGTPEVVTTPPIDVQVRDEDLRASSCDDGIHCGTPEREIVGDGECTDGVHCGTPPPPPAETSNSDKDVARSPSGGDGSGELPPDATSLSALINGFSGFKFDGGEDPEESLPHLAVDDGSRSSIGNRNSVSPCRSSNTDSDDSSTTTMSLLESLKSCGYENVMKSRQSHKEQQEAEKIANVRAKRIAGCSFEDLSSSRDSLPNVCGHANSLTTNSSVGNVNSKHLAAHPTESRSKSCEPPTTDQQDGVGVGLSVGDDSGITKHSRSESVCSEKLDVKMEESVSERIRRKSYFNRFNDFRPRKPKKSASTLPPPPPRRHSAFLNSIEDDLSARRSNFGHSLSFDSHRPESVKSSFSGLANANGSSSSSLRNFLKDDDDWFQKAETRASQMLDEMYKHDARMLQSLPLRHRSSRRSSLRDDFQPSSGYLSNLRKSSTSKPDAASCNENGRSGGDGGLKSGIKT